jgi:hypothetical protein
MSSVGLLMVHSFFPKVDQEESEHTYHPQVLNLLTSTTNMDDAIMKLIQSCSRVSATPSTAMRLAHLIDKKKEYFVLNQAGLASSILKHEKTRTAGSFYLQI